MKRWFRLLDAQADMLQRIPALADLTRGMPADE